MGPRRSLSGIALTLFALVAGLVALVFVVLLVSVVDLRGDTQSGRHSTDLLTASYGAEVSLGQLDSALRGVLIFPSGPSRTTYRRADAALSRQLGELRLLASGANEQRRVNNLTASVDRYLANYANPLIARAPTLTERQEATAADDGVPMIEQMGRQFHDLDMIELAVRQARRNKLASQTTSTIVVGAIGLAISVVLLAALGFYMLRGVLGPIRRVSEELERWGSGDLRSRVPEVGRGEVAQLGRSFNAMADDLERRTNQLSDANQRLEHAVAVAEEASRMKSDFLANMSHEIRTPLNGVVGMVTLLSDTRLSEEQREYVEMARVSSDTLMSVVSDILDVSKIEAGRLEIEHRDFDLHELIDATRDMLGQQAQRKGLRLTAGIDGEVPRGVRGDRLRVGQVLGNLVSNAVKFTAHGEVRVAVSVAEQTNVMTVVRFAVSDTGIGIAPDRLQTLFDPFTQADVSTTRQFGGTGLGLTICRDLTRLMGGTIDARSELGKGSTFMVEIPLAPAVGELVSPVPSVELRGLRILVVDDNAANRRILEAYVSSWGMRSTTARDAGQAFGRLLVAADGGEPFDVALLDLNMPGENGIDLARRITASPRLRGTRLILLSSAADGRAELKWDGIRQMLVKPVTQSGLLEAIATAMHGALPVQADAASDAEEVRPALPAPGYRIPSASVAYRRRGALPVRGARILIAEDNFVNRMFVERLLTHQGYVVETAVDGTEVLAALERGDYDLILMDCQMPELDGYATTREIRRREAQAGEGARIPIVAMTAAATDAIRKQCLDAGMDEYLTKPLADDELEQTLSSQLTPSSTGSEPLDPARLDKLESLFADSEAGAVLVRLADETRAQLERLTELAVAGNRVGVAQAAHTIRGSAQMIGASELVDAAFELEQAAGSPDGPIDTKLEALERAWERTRGAIEERVRGDSEGGLSPGPRVSSTTD